MKVVLFCGGMGMRLGGESNPLPKPMIGIGDQPIVVHIMQYYAYYGHTDFILCVGWKADVIREYFSTNKRNLPGDWSIQLMDTGIEANVGQRLRSARDFIEPGEEFFANYADGLSDVPLDVLYQFHADSGGIATFLAVQPKHNSFHVIESTCQGMVNNVYPIDQADVWMNGGFFVFKDDIFSYIEQGEELVEAPFSRLTNSQQLFAYQHNGFWGCMDTFKEKDMLDDMYAGGSAPWKVW